MEVVDDALVFRFGGLPGLKMVCSNRHRHLPSLELTRRPMRSAASRVDSFPGNTSDPGRANRSISSGYAPNPRNYL